MNIEPEKIPSILGQAKQTETPNWFDLISSLAFQKEGQYFLNQTVYLDDYTFIRCRFDNCTLITNKGTFKFIQCVIAGSQVVYSQEAYKVVKLFNSMAAYADQYPQFKATMNVDGTFNIE